MPLDPLRSRFSIRKTAWIAATALAATIAVSCIYKDRFENDYVIYALQVLSGNWPGRVSGINDYFFVIASIFAVLLNAATVLGVLTGAYELIIIRRYRRMNIRNAFNVRDQIALQDIMTQIRPLTGGLSSEQLRSIKDELWQCFKKADVKWEREFIPRAMPDSSDEFIDMINGSGPK